MNKKSISRAFAGWIVFLVLCPAGMAPATQIPMGLDWRDNVFVQLYWADNTPQYCVSNPGDQAIRLRVSYRPAPKAKGVPLKTWTLGANAVQCFDARPFLGKRFLDFQVVNGPRLGLLRPPVRPAAGTAEDGTIKSNTGLNGSCRDHGLVLEQEQLGYKSGEKVSLTLITPAKNGTIIIEKTPQSKYLEAIAPGEIISRTLPVKVEKDRILINTDRPTVDQADHRIQWTFTAPAVNTPTLYQISTKIKFSNQSWACFTRGIIINP